MTALRNILCVVVLFALLIVGLGAMAGKNGGLLAEGVSNLKGYPDASVNASVTAITYQTNVHMLEGHPEAALIVQCLNNKGPALKFKSLSDKNIYYLMCQLPDGKWGFGEYKNAGKNKDPNPITAFVRGDGSITEVFNYLQRGATKYTGPLPWEIK